jgi:hypothetical protein
VTAHALPMLDPETSLVGALLTMPIEPARGVLTAVRECDLADPQLRMVLAAVRRVVDAGKRPEPGAVLAELGQREDGTRFREGRAAGVVLADLLEAARGVIDVGPYQQQVLDQSVLRAGQATAERITQAVKAEDVDRLLEIATQGLADLIGDRPVGSSSRVTQLRERILTSEQIDAEPPPTPLIEGVLYADSLCELWGRPGHYKSFLAVDFALSIATGKDWLGHAVTRAPVLYIVGEGLAGIGKRRRAWSYAWQRNDTSDIRWVKGAVPLMEPGWVEALAQLVAETRPALIVIDTLSRSIAGHNENAPEVMSAVVASADRIREAANGACVLFVHHATKDGNTNRGHSALEGACDVRWKVEKTDRGVLTLSNPKAKDDAEADDLHLVARTVDWGETDHRGRPVTSCVIESHDGFLTADELTTSEERLVDVMRDSFGTTGATSTQLREVANLPKTSFYRSLNALVSRGALTNSGTDKRPLWHLTPTLTETTDEQ